MLSKNKAKFIKSLQIKKFRNEYNLFLVEGAKSVLELIRSDYIIKELYVAKQFYNLYSDKLKRTSFPIEILNEKELFGISSFSTNDSVVALVSMKEDSITKPEKNEWILALDSIQDPGNLGTIIRIADWYGISKIICSENTVDFYNPKVISATMGSFTRVKITYVNLLTYFNSTELPVYAAHLEGKNLHNFSFPKGGFLLMGNESEGISKDLMKIVSDSIMIPRFGESESLNVSVATGIICDAIRRVKK